jgi:hypothetical protein
MHVCAWGGGHHPVEAELDERLRSGCACPVRPCCLLQGCIELLKRSGVEMKGKTAAVVGRSNIVGLPVALLLQNEDATVTMVHSRTPNAGGVLTSFGLDLLWVRLRSSNPVYVSLLVNMNCFPVSEVSTYLQHGMQIGRCILVSHASCCTHRAVSRCCKGRRAAVSRGSLTS